MFVGCRKPDQVFVWYSRESSWTLKYFYRKNLKQFDGYFNWTMTYRLDADVDAAMTPLEAQPFLNYMYKKLVPIFVITAEPRLVTTSITYQW